MPATKAAGLQLGECEAWSDWMYNDIITKTLNGGFMLEVSEQAMKSFFLNKK